MSMFTEFDLPQKFSYKCKMVRNIHDPAMIYEAYFPTLLEKYKLPKTQSNIQKNTSYRQNM